MDELIRENYILGLCIAALLGTLIRSLVITVIEKFKKGETKTTEDIVKRVLKEKNIFTMADHEHCSNNNTHTAINELREHVREEMSEIKEWLEKLDNRLYEFMRAPR